MANNLFGTDGIRGVANEFPMTAEVAFRLAQVLSVQVCTITKRVAIAKDTRISGDMLEAALVAGFTSSGVDVVKMGVVPTFSLYWILWRHGMSLKLYFGQE